MSISHRPTERRSARDLLVAVATPVWLFFERLTVWIYCTLSEPNAIRVAHILVTVSLSPFARRRINNIRSVFLPLGWTEEQCRRVSRESVRSIARTAVETARLTQIQEEEIRSRTVLEGTEHLEQGLLMGKGVVLIANHMANLCLVPVRVAAAGFRTSVVLNRFPLQGMTSILRVMIKRFPLSIGHIGDSKAIIRNAHKNNEVLTLWYDAAASRRSQRCQWVQFGPAMLEVDTGPALLAARLGIPVLCASSRRESEYLSRITLRPQTLPTSHTNISGAVNALLSSWVDQLYKEVLVDPHEWWCWSFVDLRPGALQADTTSVLIEEKRGKLISPAELPVNADSEAVSIATP